MEQTLAQYVQECEIFERTKEYFKLYKEAMELGLMELYIEAQEFFFENGEAFSDTEKTMLLVESVDTTANDNLLQSYEEKVGNFFGKIAAIRKKIWNAIMSFFRKIADVFSGSQQKRIEQLEKDYQTVIADRDGLKKVIQDNQKEIADMIANHAFDMAKSNSEKDELQKKNEQLQKSNDNLKANTKGYQYQITVLSGENSKLAGINKLFNEVFTERDIRQKSNEMVAVLSESITIEALKIVFIMSDVFENMETLIEKYIDGMQNKGSGKGKQALDSIKKLTAQVQEARRVKMKITIDSAWANERYKAMEAKRDRWNAALDRLSSLSTTASNVDLPKNKDGTISLKGGQDNAVNRVQAHDEMNSKRVNPDKNNIVEQGTHGAILALIKEAQIASADVMLTLKNFVDKRESAIRILNKTFSLRKAVKTNAA